MADDGGLLEVVDHIVGCLLRVAPFRFGVAVDEVGSPLPFVHLARNGEQLCLLQEVVGFVFGHEERGLRSEERRFSQRCLEEGSCRLDIVGIFGQGGSKDDKMWVVGQDDALRTLGDVYAHLKHIGVFVWLVATCAMTMAADVGHLSLFEESLRMAIVLPLSDKAGIVGHKSRLHTLADSECCHAVVLVGCHQQVEVGDG